MSESQNEEYATVSAALLGIHAQETCKPRVEELELGVWLVRDVLSKAECATVRQAASQHMEMVKGTLDSQRYRDLKRSIFMSPEAAEVVYQRLHGLPLFKDNVEVLESDGTIHQGSLEGVSGVWKPYELNPCWRVIKYEAEGHFSPHFDGEYHAGPGKKSLRTFMIYLNDVLEGSGGGTLFVSTDGTQDSIKEATQQTPSTRNEDQSQQAIQVVGKQPIDESRAAQLTFDEERGKFVMSHGSRVRLRVEPEEGMAVVFNHNMLHSGEEITCGEKWVLRSEVMFEQVEQYCPVELTEDDKEAQKLLKQAEKTEEAAMWLPAGSAERQEKMKEAVALYLHVRKLSDKVAKSYGL